MDTYPFGGHHAGDMADTIRKVLGATGQRATMPADRPGVVRGAELATILKWADAFEGSRASSRSTPKHEHEDELEQSGRTH